MRAAAGLCEKLGRWDVASEEREPVTIESLLKSGAILGHKDGNYGSQYPRVAEFGSEGVPFLTAKSLNDGRIDIEGAPRLSEQRANDLRFGFVQSGDVLLSHNATVGRIAVVPNFKGKLLIGTSLTYFRVDSSRILPRYLAAFFTGSDFQAQLNAVMSQSTRNQVPITAQRKLRIVLPSLVEQAAIADILGALDDKIALIREANETQKAIAQAIFKSWFVDFDPVRAKAEDREPDGMDAATAALFPSEFQVTELGLIPKGWELKTLADIATFQNGFAFKSSDWVESGFPVVKIGNVKPGIVDLNGCSFVRGEATKSLDRFRLSHGDLLAGMTGYVGETGLMPIIDGPCYLNQRVGKLSAGSGLCDLGFVYCLVRRKEFKTFAEAQAHGSAQANVSGVSLMAYPALIPPPPLVELFNKLASPILHAILSKHRYSKLLEDLRDTLLPRLISGKLRVPEAEAMLTRV
jgi:type I restriction enzyme S subunit